MDGMNIIELLDNVKLPAFSMADRNPAVSFNTMLDMYGNFCRKNRIKDGHLTGRYNPDIHLVSENFGKTVSIEVYHPRTCLLEVMAKDFDNSLGCYTTRYEEGYKLFFREGVRKDAKRSRLK